MERDTRFELATFSLGTAPSGFFVDENQSTRKLTRCRVSQGVAC